MIAHFLQNSFFVPALATIFWLTFVSYSYYRLSATRAGKADKGLAFSNRFWLLKIVERGFLPLQVYLFWYVCSLWFSVFSFSLWSSAETLAIFNDLLFKVLFIWWLWRSFYVWEERNNTKIARSGRLSLLGFKLDRTAVAALGKLVRGFLLVLFFLLLTNQVGIDLSGLLAIGGVGGIIIGLAAQDILSNFLSSIVLYLERPFKVGDWIESQGQGIGGEVLEIGWRRTRIRTFDRRTLLVPNHVFNVAKIENYASMTHRCIRHTIGLRYQDASKIDSVVQEIQAMLDAHPDVDSRQTQLISFAALGDSALELKLVFYTSTTGYVDYHLVKQNVLLRIVDIVQQAGADFAFPTRTLHVADTDLPVVIDK